MVRRRKPSGKPGGRAKRPTRFRAYTVPCPCGGVIHTSGDTCTGCGSDLATVAVRIAELEPMEVTSKRCGRCGANYFDPVHWRHEHTTYDDACSRLNRLLSARGESHQATEAALEVLRERASKLR